jgi:hypothetical protein
MSTASALMSHESDQHCIRADGTWDFKLADARYNLQEASSWRRRVRLVQREAKMPSNLNGPTTQCLGSDSHVPVLYVLSLPCCLLLCRPIQCASRHTPLPSRSTTQGRWTPRVLGYPMAAISVRQAGESIHSRSIAKSVLCLPSGRSRTTRIARSPVCHRHDGSKDCN